MDAEQVRLLLHYEWKNGLKAAAAGRKICEAYGDDVCTERTAQRWFKTFKEGDERLTDLPRSGRPREVNREDVIARIEEEPTLTCRMLADEFDCAHNTIWHTLQEAGKKCLKTKWVPHELTDVQKQKRFDAATRLLEQFNNGNLDLDCILTCDEKWVAYDNPHRANEWRSPDQPASSTPVKDFRKDKRMLIVFWNHSGVVHYELLAKGQSMNAELYCQILRRVNRRLGNQRPILFLQDNARPHTAKATKKTIDELGWTLLEHPPYSPDLAPSDYHLFRSMEHHLRNKKFRNENELENSLISFFNSKDPEFYHRGIHLLPEMWANCIESDGDYFDY